MGAAAQHKGAQRLIAPEWGPVLPFGGPLHHVTGLTKGHERLRQAVNLPHGPEKSHILHADLAHVGIEPKVC